MEMSLPRHQLRCGIPISLRGFVVAECSTQFAAKDGFELMHTQGYGRERRLGVAAEDGGTSRQKTPQLLLGDD